MRKLEKTFANYGCVLRCIAVPLTGNYFHPKVEIIRKRDSSLSITHKFCPEIEAKLGVNKTRQSASHDSIAWWSIVCTVEVSAQPRNLIQIVG
jgi:hypothetical protein